MQYKGTKKSMPEIARELKVYGVIEGSVLRSGDQVRITAQLIQAATDTHLWARSYERDLRNVLALQSEVAGAIANEIKIKLTPQEQARLASAPPCQPRRP
jgi:TolB-like protein